MKDALDVQDGCLILIQLLPLLLTSCHDIYLVVLHSPFLLEFGDLKFGDLAEGAIRAREKCQSGAVHRQGG
jgi:hypothetical protein